jgi:dimethylargininase
MLIAITRAVPQSITRCELTHLDRNPIDVDLARRQHRAYEDALASAGCRIERLPPKDDLPDSVFVEDTAIVVDEVAVITRPGAESRRPETASVAAALRNYRELVFIEPPAILDGGDVLRIGRNVFVGQSTRTSEEGFRQLSAALAPFGYSVQTITPRGCLHLKSAVTAFSDDGVVINPEWGDASVFDAMHVISIDPSEPSAANVLRVGDVVLCATAFPRTAQRLRDAGVNVRMVDASELAKAEGALTCCSVIMELDEAALRT